MELSDAHVTVMADSGKYGGRTLPPGLLGRSGDHMLCLHHKESNVVMRAGVTCVLAVCVINKF